MKLRFAIALLVFAPIASAQSCQRLHFMEVDSSKTYQAGQKLKYDEPHGVYSGTLEADKLYFVCPVTLNVTKRGSLAKDENFEEGTISVFIRKSVEARWTRTEFAYKCEDLELSPGKMEYAVFNGKQIQVGSHNALCEFLASSNSTVNGGQTQGQEGDFAGRYPWYMASLRRRVKQNWLRATIEPAARSSHGKIGFTIYSDGTTKEIRVIESSQNGSFDNSMLRAVLASNPMPPLPKDYKDSSVSLTLDFPPAN